MHLAVLVAFKKISDDGQKIKLRKLYVFRTQRRRDAKFYFEHGKNNKNENAPCGA